MIKNQAGQSVSFQMISATDGSDVTTGTANVFVELDSGGQAGGAGAVAHSGNGVWTYDASQAETNADSVAFTLTISGAITQTVNVYPKAAVTALTAQQVWEYVLDGTEPTDSAGKRIYDFVDATISSRNAVAPDNTQGAAVIAHGDGAGAWDSIADVSALALEATAQSILTQTTRVDGLIEDSAGDQFTAKALNQAPSGGGGTDVNLVSILGTNITETAAGYLAGGLSYYFDVATPSKTMNDVGVAGSGLSQQDVADAMRLTPTGAIEVGSIDAKFGPITGSGDNNVLGFVRSLARKDITASTDIGGTFDPTTESLEALHDGGATLQEITDSVLTQDLDGYAAANSLSDRVDAKISEAGGSDLTTQDVADAMRLTPTGSVLTGSVDQKLTNVLSTGGAGPWTTGTAANAESNISLLTPSRWDIPETGTTSFDVQVYARDATGVPVNTDAPPTITAVDFSGNSLDANWAGAVTNPSTGTYVRTYNVPDTHPVTDVIFQASAEISAATRTDNSTTTVSVPIDVSDLALESTSQSILTQTTRVDGLIENVSGDRYTAKALEQAGGSSPSEIADAVWQEDRDDFAYTPNMFGYFVDARISDMTGGGVTPLPGTGYTSDALLRDRFGSDNITKWADLDNTGNSGSIDARIAQEIEYVSREIDAAISGRNYYYELPFDPVPWVIADIATSEVGYRLWMARGVEAENDVVINQHNRAMTQLKNVINRALKLNTSKAEESPATDF